MTDILIVAEADGAKVRDATLELVTLAREVAAATGWGAGAVVLGDDPSAPARDLATRGGIPVVALRDPALAAYTADGWTAALAGLVGNAKPQLVLVSHGPIGWDWAPRLAARCGGSTASECTGIRVEGGELVFTRRAFNAKLDMTFRLAAGPRVVTVQRGARPVAASTTGADVTTVDASLTGGIVRGRAGGVKAGPAGRLDLSQADVIVSGGRSLGGPEKFDIIRDLAAALGGQVGASRPVTDAGWLPPEHQVGSSGVTVKPKLYVACGISGAIQHVVGMKSSDYIIAINKDARAPIFEVAHVGVVGDLFEIVPALTAAVKAAKG